MRRELLTRRQSLFVLGLLLGLGMALRFYKRQSQVASVVYFNQTARKENDRAFLLSLKTARKKSNIEYALVMLKELPAGETMESFAHKFLNENKNFTLENFLSGAKIYVLENGKMEEKVADVRFGFYYDPRFPNEIKTITTYGRYNDEGKKSNVAQGGGVAEITIVKDENFKTCHEKLLKAYRSLDKEDLKQLQALLNENTNKANLQYNGKPFPIAITPFIVSESAFRKVEKTALFLAQKIVAKREGENKGKAFIFALDAFINPSPDTDKN
jgi:hypothetical protein